MFAAPEFTILYGLLACIAGYLLFKYCSKVLLYQKKKHLVARYKQLRLESIKIQEEVSSQVLAGNGERPVVPGHITFYEYYRKLKHNHVTHLSSKLIDKLQKSHNPLLIKKTENELREQEEWLRQAHNFISGLTID